MAKYISVDLEPQGLFAVAGTVQRGTAKVEQALAWLGGESENSFPAITLENAKRIGEQLRDRLRTAGFTHAPVVVTVGRDRIVLKEVRYPKVPAHEEPNIVRFQALKELSDSPEDVVLDYVPLANGAAEGESRSTAVAVRKDLYAAIQAMCTAASLKLAAVTPRPYAIAAGVKQAFALGTAPAPASGDAIAILTVGVGGGEFNVVRNGEVTFTVAVPAPVTASEPMLLAQVRRNLTTYAGSNPGHPVQALYVAEADGRWSDRLQASLGIPVHAYDPLAGSVPGVPEGLRGRFAGAAGLLAAQSATLPINFASPRQPKAEADPGKNRMMLLALLALVVFGVGLFAAWHFLGQADDKVTALIQQRDARKAEFAKLEPDQKRLDAAKQWQGRRVVWLDELFEMTARTGGTTEYTVASFIGKAVPPEKPDPKADPKTAKPGGSAKLDLKVSARTSDTAPVNALVDAIDRDNTDPKNKYYVGTNKTRIGQGRDLIEYTVTTQVAARQPETFARAPSFKPPSRKSYPPNPVPARTVTKEPVETDPAEDPKDREAPAPKAKPEK